MTVTFFGHRDAPFYLSDILKEILRDLIVNKGADVFYVGNNGAFDSMVTGVLKDLKREYPHIVFCVVLAYLSKVRVSDNISTIYPEGMETIPPRFAINKRNEWMIKQSDMVIVWVVHSGGAHKFMELSIKKGKQVINLYNHIHKD